MTEYEIYDLILTQQAGVNAALAIYLSLVSAYLVIAFFAGKQLNRSQALTVSTLFVVAAFMFVGVMYVRSREIFRLSAQLETISDGAPAALPGFGAPVFFILLFGGVVASLKFMWDVRRRNES